MVWRPYRSRRDSRHNLVRIAFATEIRSYNLNHFSGNPQEVGYGCVIDGFTISTGNTITLRVMVLAINLRTITLTNHG